MKLVIKDTLHFRWNREGIFFRLWHIPYNSLWISFDRKNVRRGISWFRKRGYKKAPGKFIILIFGLCFNLHLSTWPWHQHPKDRF